MNETQPLPTDAERALFEAEWLKVTGETASTWDAVCASAGEPVPAHVAGRYFARATHAAWRIWQAARRTPAPVGAEPVAWAFQHDDGTWHDPSLTEHSAGMKGLAPAEQELAMERVPQAGVVTADDLKQPGNGAQWRVEWWNESCRMLLPANKKLDRFQAYRNGTLMFTIKEKSGIKGGQHGAE